MFRGCESSDRVRDGQRADISTPGMSGRIVLFCKEWLAVGGFEVSGLYI